MYEKMTNQQKITRTLSFNLSPVKETLKNFMDTGIRDRDEDKADTRPFVQSYFDRFYKKLIEDVLSKLTLDDLDKYAEDFYSKDNFKGSKEELKEIKDNLRKAEIAYDKAIHESFYNGDTEKNFKKEYLQMNVIKLVLDQTTDSKEYEDIIKFTGFKGYLDPYFQARENMFGNYNKANTISSRIINDNLSTYLKNCVKIEKIINALPDEDISAWTNELEEMVGVSLQDLTKPETFSSFLSQSGIDRYNLALGGYAKDKETKIRGLNEYVNIYNTKCDSKDKLPHISVLYKMILSDKNSSSYKRLTFSDDQEVVAYVNEFAAMAMSVIEQLDELFENLKCLNTDKIYLPNIKDYNYFGRTAYKNYNVVRKAWETKLQDDYKAEQEKENEERKKKRKIKKYSQKQLDSKWKEIKYLSIKEFNELIKHLNPDFAEIESFIASTVENGYNKTVEDYDKIKDIISKPYPMSKTLFEDIFFKNDLVVFLDDVRKLVRFTTNFVLPEDLADKLTDLDETFYQLLEYGCFCLSETNQVYNGVRSYAVKEPYQRTKFKLNFDNSRLGSGWDINKENESRTFIFTKDNNYYVGFGRKGANHLFEDCFVDDSYEGSTYNKMMYKQMGSASQQIPRIFLTAKGRRNAGIIPDDIIDIYDNRTFKPGNVDWENNKNKLIAFVISSIKQYEKWNMYSFNFKEPESYNDFEEFEASLGECAYQISFNKVPETYIDELVKKGDLFLFVISNKDFSKYSHGIPNLHTMYFKALFEPANLSMLTYKLCGGASVFYKLKSIPEEKIIRHKANEPIKNKGYSKNEYSTFSQDIIKDRRKTMDSFEIHIPIQINPHCDKADQKSLNQLVLDEAIANKEQYIIGIDRGEKNLIYAVVINKKGEIVEQRSLNIIDDVDFLKKLIKKSEEIKENKEMLMSTSSMKKEKTGYVSKAINEICKLAVKYDAIIALEDLNSNFSTHRNSVVEYAIYTQFENMLTEKLSCYVNKHFDKADIGGLYNPLQLTVPGSESSFKWQNGIMMFVDPAYTSAIDPVTGFVNEFFHPYTNINNAKEFFGSFEDIRYNSDEDHFEFDVDYDNVRGNQKNGGLFLSYRRKWIICSNGRRLVHNKKASSKYYQFCDVILTKEFKALFAKYDIDINANLKEQILENSSKDFFESLLNLFKYTCQLRNSDSKNGVDYILSPVKSPDGTFFDSRKYIGSNEYPQDSDANGAYHIAHKALITLKRIEGTLPEVVIETGKSKSKTAKDGVDYYVSREEWFAYTQK